MQRKNVNRGYMTLHVWQNAVILYKEICRVFRSFPYELKRNDCLMLMEKEGYYNINPLIH